MHAWKIWCLKNRPNMRCIEPLYSCNNNAPRPGRGFFFDNGRFYLNRRQTK